MSSIKCTTSANDVHRLSDGEVGEVNMGEEVEFPSSASIEQYPSHSPPQHQKKCHCAAPEGTHASGDDVTTRRRRGGGGGGGGEPTCTTTENETRCSSHGKEGYPSKEGMSVLSTLPPTSSLRHSPPVPHHSDPNKSLLERGKSTSKEEDEEACCDSKVEKEAGPPGYPLHPSSFVGSAHSRMSPSLERSSPQVRDETKKNNSREKVPRWKKCNRFNILQQPQEAKNEEQLGASSSSTSTSSCSSTLTSFVAASSSLSCLHDDVEGEEVASQSDQSVGRANSSSTQGGNDVEVPLITPRHQRRHRVVRRMNVTDSTPAVQKTSSLLNNRTTEFMTIKQGPLEYTEKVHFQTYELFRHSKGKIHTRSVGYSDDGDFVMFREDLSQATDDVKAAVRRTAEIYNPTVLDPSAKAPPAVMDDASSSTPSRQTKKKYPGIRAPRNKKIRNRLCNDFFASDVAKPILDQAREYEKEEEREEKEGMYSSKPIFCPLPHPLDQGFDVQDEKDAKIAEKYWSPQQKPPPSPVDPNSPEARLQLLNTRLRAEVQRALSSKFLSQQMEDLEANFILFISSHNANTNNNTSTSGTAKKSLVFNFQNGYSRLICHGIATYYGLISQSFIVHGAPGSQHSPPNTLSSTNATSSAPPPPPSSSIASSRGGRGNDSTATTVKLTLVSLPQSSKKKKKVGKSKPLETSDTLLELPYIPLMQCLRPSSFSRLGVSTASTASSSPGLGPVGGEASSSMYFLPEEISSCSSTHLISESEVIGDSTLDLSPPVPHPCACGRGEKDGHPGQEEKVRNDEGQNEQDGSEHRNGKKKRQSVVGEWMEECAKEESGMRSSGVPLSHPFPPSSRAQRSGTPLCSPICAVATSLHTEASAVQSMQASPALPPLSHHSYTPSPYITRHMDIPATPPSFSFSHSPQDWMSWGSCPSYNTTIRVVQGGGGGDVLNGCDIPPLYEPQLCLAPLPLGTPSFSIALSGSPSPPPPPPLALPPPATAVPSLSGRNGMSETGKKLVPPTTLVTMTNVNLTFRLSEGVPPSVSLSPYKDFSNDTSSRKREEENKVKDEGGREVEEEGGGTCGTGASFTVAEWMAIREHLVTLGLQIRPIGVSNGGRKNS